jgi:UDP-glucuronate 4-epimerase
MSKRKVLVTGATGNVGTPLSLLLLEQGCEVHCTALFGDSTERTERERTLEEADVVCWNKDLTKDSLDDMPDDFEYVYHEAVLWGMGPEETAQDKRRVYDTNTLCIGNVMSRWRNVKAMAIGSTGGLFSQSPELVNENSPVVPEGTYHQGKFAMEQTALFCSTHWNIPVTILRYCWPANRFEDIAREIVDMVQNGKPLVDSIEDPYVYTPTDIRDTVRYTARAVEAAEVPPKVLVCTGAEVVSRKMLCGMAGEILGKEPVLQDAPRHPKRRCLGDASRLYELYGPPEHSVTEVLKRVATESRT